jgi:ribosomal protein S18 acetylase RimI-like enzyme
VVLVAKTIRQLTSADTKAYRDLRLEGLRLSADAFCSTWDEESARPVSFFTDWIAQRTMLGGFVEQQLCGIACLRILGPETIPREGMINAVYVSEAFRGIGMARDLMDAAVTHARHQVDVVTLNVLASNTDALRFYEQYGFENCGIAPSEAKTCGQFGDEILMSMPMPSNVS